ncbi:MAG: phenylalanine--tRNA ligase subunit beta, partial [Saprospiraceae bacterium]
EVEGIDYIEYIKGSLKGVVVGEILECIQHPNADRLRLTKVNIGMGHPVQIVCGASNVGVGQKVLVATEGTTVSPMNGNPFQIKKSKIRGEESCGMICAEDELGLSNNHDGIMILDSKAIVGNSAADYLELRTEAIFEVGLTPNRADATSHLGVARDLAAWYKVHEKTKKEIHFLHIHINPAVSNSKIKFQVNILRQDLCPRYSGVCLSNIKVGPSPDWLQKKLLLMDQKPINNIVDITNYILFHYGQPLHAFDLAKIPNHSIVVNTLQQGTKFQTLDGQEIVLSSSDLMICDDHQNGLCIAGVMGGLNSGVTENTTSIFLESAYFKAGSVRKTSMHHLLRSNAAKLFEKGSDPNMAMTALEAAVSLIMEMCNAEICSNWIDHYPNPILPSEIELNLDYVNSLSGMNFNDSTLKEVLFGLEMEVRDHRDGHYTVFVGTNKPDVTRPADVVEEICRVYGLEHIPIPEKIQISFPVQINSLHGVRQNLSNFLSSRGLNEILNLSLCSSEICLASGIWKEEDLVYINNTSNANLDIMTPSLVIAGLNSILFNSNRQQLDLTCYEFGKEYLKRGEEYLENQKLGIFFSGNKNAAHWNNSKVQSVDFFDAKRVVEEIIQYYGIGELKSFVEESNSIFHYSTQWKFGSNELAICGELSRNLLKQYDLKKPVFYAEIDLKNFQHLFEKRKTVYSEISKFPSSKRDLAVVVSNEVTYSDIENIVYQSAGKNLKEVSLFDIYVNEGQLGANNKSLALSLLFESNEKSLSSTELDLEIEKIISKLESKLQAKIRR